MTTLQKTAAFVGLGLFWTWVGLGLAQFYLFPDWFRQRPWAQRAMDRTASLVLLGAYLGLFVFSLWVAVRLARA